MFSKLTLLIFCCFVFSCSLEKKEELKIAFSSDRTVILFTGIGEVSLFRAKEQAAQRSQEVVSVFETNESLGTEKQVSGHVEIKGDTLFFIPLQPFVKGRQYEVNTVLNSSFGKTEDLLKADMGKTVKRQQKILVR